MRIVVDDLRGAMVRALLAEHLAEMAATSPPESMHALDVAGLQGPNITFWTIWQREALAGCGALKALDPAHGEIKSMRTASGFLRQGVARRMLQHILEEATRRGFARVSLETGSQPHFEPARRLYAAAGFEPCGPFADYVEDPNSVFMTLCLGPAHESLAEAPSDASTPAK